MKREKVREREKGIESKKRKHYEKNKRKVLVANF